VEDERAIWVYCVARREDPLPEQLPGVDPEHAVERVERGDLAALVSRVRLAEFGEEPLRRNLNDLPWLERVARGHEAVLERALEHATIVPARLCTIFADEQGAGRMLEEQRAELGAALDALAGRSEWSVKLLVDPSALEAAARGAEPDASRDRAAPGSGADYMLRRREERELRELTQRIAGELAEDVHARLRECASDAVLNAPQNRELSEHEGDMLLNAAYLVETAAIERLREAVDELQDRHRTLGARLVLSGPFPPFNFVPRPQATPA
jgi:hypothetical protein